MPSALGKSFAPHRSSPSAERVCLRSAEKAVNDRLEQTPELYLLAIAQSPTSADTELMRSFSLVLLRRLLFRPPSPNRLALYDQRSAPAILTLERILLHSLLHSPAPVVRHKTVDTVTDLSNYSMKRGRPWHMLQSQVFAMADNTNVHTREAAFRVFAPCRDNTSAHFEYVCTCPRIQ
ncbi:hypothetical protein VTO73DRAFT_15601 [Trametes versicolor]